MKYYLVVGEASGDLHASNLMRALLENDKQAEFRFFGGDLMNSVGGECIRHYREMAYMGFIPVLLHLPQICRNMTICKSDILAWQPDVVILVDYPGFNLSIARYIRKQSNIPVYYYISPKIWAWKEYRIKNIKRDVNELFSILPFEVDFFEQKHKYPIHYIGNPTADEVSSYNNKHGETFQDFAQSFGLSNKPVIALLAGSRKQEIKDNLPLMLKAASDYLDSHQLILAGAPGIDSDFYKKVLNGMPVTLLFGHTFRILKHSQAALVTSGTATLEAALFGVPQVVCYYMKCGKLVSFLRARLLKVKYISLVNLILNRQAVTELVADGMTLVNVRKELSAILPGGNRRELLKKEYKSLELLLGGAGAATRAAQCMIDLLRKNKPQ